MRKTKFRAWTGEEMTDKVAIAGNGHVTTWHTENSLVGPRLTSVDWEIMQSTGLQDKNGKDIYEGDVLEDRYEDKMEESGFGEIKYIIAFKEGSFGWIGDITGKFFPFCQEPMDSAVIVGNIYQHPELLTPAK